MLENNSPFERMVEAVAQMIEKGVEDIRYAKLAPSLLYQMRRTHKYMDLTERKPVPVDHIITKAEDIARCQ